MAKITVRVGTIFGKKKKKKGIILDTDESLEGGIYMTVEQAEGVVKAMTASINHLKGN